jgi:hypothetical protein
MNDCQRRKHPYTIASAWNAADQALAHPTTVYEQAAFEMR